MAFGVSSGSKSRGKKTFSRESKHLRELEEAVLQSQLHVSSLTTDVNLICKGGVIPAHAVLLSNASSLFQKAIESQGENYLLTRDILLPDFNLMEMRKVVQLLYTGSTLISTENELDSLKETLTYLQIESWDNFISTKDTKLSKSPQKSDFSEIRFIKGTNDVKKLPAEVVTLNDDVEEDSVNPVYKEKKLPKNKETKRKYSDSEWEPDTDDDDKEKSTSKCSTVTVKTSNSVPGKVVEIIASKKSKTTKVDTDNLDWEEPKYNDKKWFETEACKCQFCKKVHESPAHASTCITGHQRLRCYFCFRVCKNTENLFEHFRRQHKQAGRENSLLCPYCEQTIPFKSVSCHVISLHLSDIKTCSKTDDKTTSSTPTKAAITIPYRPRQGRPAVIDNQKSAVVVVEKTNIPAALIKKNPIMLPKKLAKETAIDDKEPSSKKPKLEPSIMEINNTKNSRDTDDGLIRVENLDVTIRRRGLDGKIWTWNIKKSNPPKMVSA